MDQYKELDGNHEDDEHERKVREERLANNKKILEDSGVIPKFKENDSVLYIEYISCYERDRDDYPYNLYRGKILEVSYVEKRDDEIIIEYFITTKRGWRNMRQTYMFFDLNDFIENVIIEPYDEAL